MLRDLRVLEQLVKQKNRNHFTVHGLGSKEEFEMFCQKQVVRGFYLKKERHQKDFLMQLPQGYEAYFVNYDALTGEETFRLCKLLDETEASIFIGAFYTSMNTALLDRTLPVDYTMIKFLNIERGEEPDIDKMEA